MNHPDFFYLPQSPTSDLLGQQALAQVPVNGPPPSTSSGGTSVGTSDKPASSTTAMLLNLAPIAIFIVVYFFFIAPQGRKAKELDSKLKKGDAVVTSSGLLGKIVELSPTRATLEIAPGVKVRVLRSAIASLDEGEPKQDSKSDKGDGKDKSEAKK